MDRNYRSHRFKKFYLVFGTAFPIISREQKTIYTKFGFRDLWIHCIFQSCPPPDPQLKLHICMDYGALDKVKSATNIAVRGSVFCIWSHSPSNTSGRKDSHSPPRICRPGNHTVVVGWNSEGKHQASYLLKEYAFIYRFARSRSSIIHSTSLYFDVAVKRICKGGIFERLIFQNSKFVYWILTSIVLIGGCTNLKWSNGMNKRYGRLYNVV